MDGALSEMLSNCSWLVPAVNVDINVNVVHVWSKKKNEKINGTAFTARKHMAPQLNDISIQQQQKP